LDIKNIHDISLIKLQPINKLQIQIRTMRKLHGNNLLIYLTSKASGPI